MDKTEIARLTHSMESKADLLALLNRIKRDKMIMSGVTFYPFKIGHLNYYCNPNHVFNRYKQFEIQKRSGGFRVITSPRNKSFLLLLQCVNEIFKAVYTPSMYAMGFSEGRSVVDNAAIHKGHNYIFNVDLKDFFPSIEQARLWKRLQLEPFNFSKTIASVLAGLCFMKEQRVMNDGTYKDFYVLPQGAPTSPIITNMICDKLDRRLAGLAKRFGLCYSRYADDITFSSMHNVYQVHGEFRKELSRIITDQGFVVNDNKTRLQKIGGRQEVTGIIVSTKLNVAQKYVRDIRNLLYIWGRYGYSIAYVKFLELYNNKNRGVIKQSNPDMIKVLYGRLMYLKMVKGQYDIVYQRLFKRMQELLLIIETHGRNDNGVQYVDTMPVLEFERKVHATIDIVFKETIGILDNITAHRYGYFRIGENKIWTYVSRSLPDDCMQQKENLAISSCRNKYGKSFWLIHKFNKVYSHNKAFVDIDVLNDELDYLLALSDE